MRWSKSTARWTIGVALVFLVLFGLLIVRFAENRWRAHNPQFQDNFALQPYGSLEEHGWKAFGGAWQVSDGAMQNISDDRGAKLVNGNSEWRDYIIESDVQLLSETGDAGFVIRTNDEEVGVDAYHGYFAGLRDLDDSLILGRADYGWHEFESRAIHSRVHTRAWYHLRVIAVGCVIAAASTTPEGEVTTISVEDANCIQEGRFGLQSYSTGAIWRNVRVHPATSQDLTAMLGGTAPRPPASPPRDSAHLPVNPALSDLAHYEQAFAPMQRELRDNHADLNPTPIASLRLLAPNVSPQVTVHGVVTLVSPVLFIQDSSGGIAVPNAHTIIPVQIGDAVEATGEAELHHFSSTLRNATVHLLWSQTPVPAVAVTAAQAASGGFDAQFVEVDGRLASVDRSSGNSLTLQLDEGSQSFLGIASVGTSSAVSGLRPGSRLRLRGVCISDRAFTRDEVPFAILLRSVGDAQVIAPPPFWNTTHIIEFGALLLAILIGVQVLHTSMERSRLRAIMEERERLAMDMHDTLAQSFAGLGFQLEALCDETKPGSLMHHQLESTLGLVRFGHMQARRNIMALRPANLERLGLIRALEEAARLIVRGSEINIDLVTRGERRELPLFISDALFRIGQEALANAVRHGRPASIRIRLRFGPRCVGLTIHDDGRGFSPSSENEGFGMRSMRHRANRISAALLVRSAPGRGTTLIVLARAPRQWLSYLRLVSQPWKNSYVPKRIGK